MYYSCEVKTLRGVDYLVVYNVSGGIVNIIGVFHNDKSIPLDILDSNILSQWENHIKEELKENIN